MKRKFLVFSSALVIAAVSFAAGKKFAPATDLWARPAAGGTCEQLITPGSAPSSLFVTSGTGQQAQLKSAGGTLYNVYENSGCSNAIYFH